MPVRFETCGLPAALSATLRVPVLEPVAVGLNTTLMVHFDLAARLAPHVVDDLLKSPVVEIEIPVRLTLCSFIRVKTFAGLVTPTFSVGNVALTGVSLA